MKITGYYIRVSGNSAEVSIRKSAFSPDDRYVVEGEALWGENRPFGPNFGHLEFVSSLDQNTIEHKNPEKPEHTITMTFHGDRLSIVEENYFGVYGMNVNFNGEYKKITPIFNIWHAAKAALRRLLS